jgi:1-phosphofructokinase
MEQSVEQAQQVVTVTINPAIDQSIDVPNFTAGAVNRVRSARLDPGGKGVNVASFLSDYGQSVTVTGFLGADNDAIFRRFFERKGIADRFIRIPGETRTGIKIVDDARLQTTDVNFPGSPPGPADVERLLDDLRKLANTNEWFVLAGSVPAGVSPDLYRQMVDTLVGRSVVVDTSGEALRRAIAAGPTLIKPNADELAQLVGRRVAEPADIVRTARSLSREHGIARVVVSLGREGAIFVAGDEAIWAVPPAVTVKSTVGAGDALVAGIVAGQIDGLCWAECARLATAFAACAVARVGSGLPSLDALRSIAERVDIRYLDD